MLRLALASIIALALVGCDQAGNPAVTETSTGRDSKPAPVSQQPATAAEPAQGAGHGGPVIELGTTQIGGFTVRASRDQGEITPGGDAPIDVWVTSADGQPATVTAVRFWIGAEDAAGSVKARADIEDATQPNHWHTHAEVPDPLPETARLWVEIETGAGKDNGSFELHR